MMAEMKPIPIREEMILHEAPAAVVSVEGAPSVAAAPVVAAGGDAFAAAAAASGAAGGQPGEMSWSSRRRTDTSWESCLEVEGQKFYVDLMSRKEVARYLKRINDLRELAVAGTGSEGEGLRALEELDTYVDANTEVLKKHIKMWSLPFPCTTDEIGGLTLEAVQKIFMALFLKSKSGLSAMPF